ncbi:MAG TPA: amino acid adenylation domain-containing protein [Chitinophaga sp.]|uniref:non-ribosomal peptide synthetase n=1 Tax=Chitinophaga sp. TaxID=1869181 RepID=UPI002C1CE29E|nr:non-ribosomal peptide synthetase [Chitinophaga sp.]HVI44929.1 amino acid adenylation domain-containing protein [Chitinophaga sp.]
MKTIISILSAFRSKGIHFSLDDTATNLKVQGNIQALQEEDKQLLKQYKDDIIALLKKAGDVSHMHITAAATGDSYRLSSAQRRLWVLSQFEEGSVAYNMTAAFQFDGNLGKDALEYAFGKLIVRHEMLRTVFRTNEHGEVRQVILSPEQLSFRLVFNDISQEQNQDDLLKRFLEDASVKPFDLAAGPLLRAFLFRLNDRRWVLSYTIHHIVCDAWSMGILIRELLSFYTAGKQNENLQPEPLRIQYKDYADWQQEQLHNNAFAQHKDYWLQQFAGEIPVLELQGKTRPAVKTYRGDVIRRKIAPELCAGLRSISQEQGGTLFMGLLSVVNLLLYKYTGQKDIIIGSPVAGREHPDLAGQIGFYLNVLPLRVRFEGTDSYHHVLTQVRDTTMDAYGRQAYPFDELVTDLNLQRDAGRSALFDVFIDYHDTVSGGADKTVNRFGDLEVMSYPVGEHVVSKFDLTFMFIESEEGVHLSLEYNSDLYNREMIDNMHGHFRELLKNILADPSAQIRRIACISGEEKNSLLNTFNNTPQHFAGYRNVVAMFEEQAAKHPDRIAVTCKGTKLTYRELDEKGNQLANYLRDGYGAGANQLVGIMLDRSEKMVVALLGILKAGAAYVPVDPEYPQSRREYIIKSTGIKVLLTQTEYIFDLSYYSGGVFAVDAQLDLLNNSKDRVNAVIQEDHMAYVIYTSGSTGVPKGCVLNHGNVSNYIQWANDYYFKDKPAPDFGLFTSLSFDLTVTSIFCPLTSGGKIHVYSSEEHIVSVLNHSFSAGSGINSIKLTPSHINVLNHLEISSGNIHSAIVGGEEVTPVHVSILKRINPDMIVYNEYGPTESTVGCVVKPLEENEEVLIGRPISNTEIYILGDGDSLCPVGVNGELCISGAGLAQGYLNQPELTAQRFIPNPFKEGERLYRTGDIARWESDGQIKYLGRADDQVKIRGYRIETGEIERVLLNHEAIDQCVVLVRKDEDGEKELVAYVTGSALPGSTELRSWLTGQLPAYMLPAYFVPLSEIPLTINGKVDKRQLPDPKNMDGSTAPTYEAPESEIHRQLIALLEKLLKRSGIGIRDNFFAIGGDSLKAVTFIIEIRKQLGLEISINKLYELPVIADLAEYLSAGNQEKESVSAWLKAGWAEIEKVSALVERENATKQRITEPYEDIYPVVPIEQGMIYSSMLNTIDPVYYDQFSYLVHIEDLDMFRKGMEHMVQRHAMLRTKYYMGSFSQPVKVVLREIPIPLSYEDISGCTEAEQAEKIREYIHADLSIRLQFDGDLLWRVMMFKLGPGNYYVTYSFHHALLDGWSVSVMRTELANYNGAAYTPLKHSYKDYCAVSLGKRKSGKIDAYWEQLLDGYTRNKLPFNHRSLAISTEGGMKKISRVIDETLLAQLTELATARGLSFKSVALAAHMLLLHVITGEKDVVTGVVTHERPEIEDSEHILGCFLNTVPARIRFEEVTDILSLLEMMHSYLIAARPNEIHLSEIAAIIGEKSTSGNLIFDTILNYTDFHTYEDINSQSTLRTLESALNENGVGTSFEMTNTLFDVEVDKTLDRFSVNIKYSPAYFNEKDAVYASELYVRILSAIAADVHTPVKSLQLLSEHEVIEIVYDFNATAEAFDESKTLHALLEEQVQRTPDGIALRQDGMDITYSELNERANRLAHYLVEKGVNQGDNIGLLASRSFSMIIGMFGILKAGGAYVPVEPEYPVDRQEYILENSAVTLVLTDGHYPLEDSGRLNMLTMDDTLLAGYSGENLMRWIDSKQLAYTIYTSGSTGRPKGVMIEHWSAVNLVEWVNDTFQVGAHDRLLFITSMCFDLSVYDIFGTLAAGGTIVIARQEDVQDVSRLKTLLLEERITFWDSVPTTMNYLVMELEGERSGFSQTDLRVVFMSGDWIPVQLPDRIRRLFPNAAVISLGGATEGTVWSNYYPVDAVGENWSSIPYGKPIRNNTFYILNDQLMPVPRGVAGELYIGGVGVARGYANDPVKTANSFVQDPFITSMGGRMYKTGDLGRLATDGNMEFLGRKDNQVKIRGYRVELGEIESALLKHPGIREAIVDIFRDADNNNQLCAYLVPEQEEPDRQEIREFLRVTLPAYMVPNQYMMLEAMPLNSNGKINRKALPAPAENTAEQSAATYIAPSTPLEIRIADIWKSILHVQKIGIHDDVFEMGASSLSVGAFINRLHREMDIRLNIRDVFANPTVEGIAALSFDTGSSFATIVPAAKDDAYPLSSSQRQLWMLSQFADVSMAYHMPGVYVFEGELDIVALQYAFNKLIARHESLRTVFREDGAGDVRQQVRTPEEMAFSIEVKDISHENNKNEKARAIVQEEILHPFDLAAGPLMRAGLLLMEERKWLFVFVIHHIVSDGWSTFILINELMLLYNSRINGTDDGLTPLRIQYKDYAVWQQAQLENGSQQEHRNWWMQQFTGELPVLNLPTDMPRPSVKTYNGGSVFKTINPAVTGRLKTLLHQQGATLFMGLLAVVKLLLNRYTGQEDIIIGSPVAGRDHVDLENQIGFYVNTIALRTKFNSTDSYNTLLQHIRQVALGAYEHQVYPFDELAYDLNLLRDASRGTLFDVMMVLQNAGMNGTQPQKNMGELTVSAYESEDTSSKFDLVFDFAEASDGIRARIEYNSDIFYPETIQRLAAHFENLLEQAVTHPDMPGCQLDMISQEEKGTLLETFNNTAKSYPDNKTLAALFETQAALTPGNTALIFGDTKLSYRGLNEQASRLSHYLRKHYNILPDSLVGIRLERSEHIAVAMLGVLKSGAGIVSVDPTYPQERIDYIMQDSGCNVVIDEQELTRFLNEAGTYPVVNPVGISGPRNLAYVIYTSGSTGSPKGCMLENRGVINHLFSKIDLLEMNENTVICHNSALHFVGGIWQLWAPLVTGGCVALCDDEELKDVGRLLHKAETLGADMLEVIPSQLNEYLSHEKEIRAAHIKTLILTGEKLNAHFVDRCYAGNPQMRIVNTYGQTEFSDVTDSYIIPRNYMHSTIPAGQPVQNTRNYVLSPNGSLCPIGVIGEVCTSGDGLCRGYINKPALTAEKFVPNPFEEGALMFRTGDLGRWLPDGTLEITGRKDDQIKIRGFRIEIAEITNALLQHEGLEEAVVLFQEATGLTAYISGNKQFTATEIRAYLSNRIPYYMVPAAFVQLDSMPLLENGKVNKKILPLLATGMAATNVSYTPPQDEIETALVKIWEEVLNKDRIGVHDNFFELGGHSLKATVIANKIKHVIGVGISLKEIFRSPEIHTLGEEIRKKQWLEDSRSQAEMEDESREIIRL